VVEAVEKVCRRGNLAKVVVVEAVEKVCRRGNLAKVGGTANGNCIS
jgi:hypothetical protein